jgi:hypothetical protein
MCRGTPRTIDDSRATGSVSGTIDGAAVTFPYVFAIREVGSLANAPYLFVVFSKRPFTCGDLESANVSHLAVPGPRTAPAPLSGDPGSHLARTNPVSPNPVSRKRPRERERERERPPPGHGHPKSGRGHFWESHLRVFARGRRGIHVATANLVNMAPTKDEVAEDLADTHFRVEPDLQRVIRILADDEDSPEEPIKLLEVNAATVPTGSVARFAFGASATVPFPIVIAEITPEEYEQLQRHELAMPPGWSLSKVKELTRKSP